MEHDTALVRQVWAAIGAEYFETLAKHLSDALATDLAYVGEFRPHPLNRVNTLAVRTGRSKGDAFGYAVPGTAAEEALKRGISIYPEKVALAFPSDTVLRETRAEAFAAKGLFDSTGRAIGVLGLQWRRPLVEIEPALSALQAFAHRTASELERKRAEEGLRETQQRYRAFVAGNKDAMWRVEFDQPVPLDAPEDEQIDYIYRYGYVAECNQALADMAGVATPDELIGARFADLAPRTEERVQDLRSVIRSREADSVEVRSIGPGGKPVYRLRSHVAVVENGRLLRVWITSRDIGELRRAELEWQASERRFRQVLETIRVAAVLADPGGRITFCNDYVLELTGWRREELTGRKWLELIPEEDWESSEQAFAELVAGVRPNRRLVRRLRARDGSHRLLEWDTTALRDADGTINGVASLGTDITERTALEQRVREAERFESMGKLASGLAHDFNSVLTVIRGYTGLLLDAHKSGPLHTAVQEIIRASEQGSALARQLLAFGRKQPVEPRPLSLNHVVLENENLIRRLAGDDVQVVISLDESAGLVLSEPVQVFQILSNLVVNARDAMPEGGKLTISTKAFTAGEHAAEGFPDLPPGPYVEMAVADTGMGMTEDVKAHLFEPFFTTKAERGTGLGLAIVYGIVRQSGGQIAVQSEPGEGAALRIALPVVSLDTAGAAPAHRAREAPATILVVDDQAALKELAGRALRRSGYNVLEAGSGPEALSIAERHPEVIHLLLTEVTLPGMSGIELARRLRSTRPGLKVLFTSGVAQHTQGEAFIEKPFMVGPLRERIRELLEGAQN